MKLNTEERYLNVSKRLLDRFFNEENISWKQEPSFFVSWFHSLTSEWSKSTFRQYKASLIYYFGIYGNTDIVYAMEELKKKKQVEQKNKRTSQQKSKRLTKEDFIQILNGLNETRSGYKTILSQWLYCGEITGLRPIEWHESRLIRNDNGVFLTVKNAKNSNNRSNGDYRTIVLSDLTFEDQSMIDSLVNTLSIMSESDFTSMYNSCRKLLHKTCRKAFKSSRKEYPTLYSARHQFSANAKGTGFSLEEIAALMGHASNETATSHYGKKRFFKNEAKVHPIESEVNTVRKKYKAPRFGASSESNNLEKNNYSESS